MRLRNNLTLAALALTTALLPAPDVLWDFTGGAQHPGFSLTRAGPATYVDQDGSIKTAAADVPRYDWTGGVKALLGEPSATNLALWSDDFTNASWAKDAAASVASGIVGPDGSSVTSLVTSLASGSASISRLVNAAAVSTFSVYVKMGSAQYAYIQISDATNAGGIAVSFNLAAGAASASGWTAFGSPSGQSISGYDIKQVGGFYRISASFTGIAKYVGFGFSGAPASRTMTVGSYGYAWGAQLEAGPQATSYIPTGASAVIRATDVIANINMAPIWAAAGLVAGTIVVDVEAYSPIGANRSYIWNINDATARLTLRASTGGLGALDICRIVYGPTLVVDLAAPLRGRHRIAVAYAEGASLLSSIDGSATLTTGPAYTHDAAYTTLREIFYNFNGRVRSMAVYRSQVSAATLQQMSALT